MSVTMQQVMEVIHRYQPKDFAPKIGIILGSGMSALAEAIDQPATIPYKAIPGLQSGTVAGHASLMVMGRLSGIPVVCMRGRLHMYEGASPESIKILVRIMKHMGCHTVVITAAAGSLNPEVGAGEVMMITDHINFQPGNPMVGPNDESEGPRFFAMDDAYDKGLQDIMQAAATKLSIPLSRGVYVSTLGPMFETPAEIRAFKMLGADLVGMSVVPEVIVARHCGLKVLGLAAITNLAAGMSTEKITHEGTLQFGEIASRKMTKLVPEFLKGVMNAMG